ncbi:MAG TPA: outer membrane beta-barrel protein [Chryseolinea sp.]
MTRFVKFKSIILSVVLILVSIQNSCAQLSKGTFLMGGTLSANAKDTKGQSSEWINRSINLNPNLSYFVANNLALGLVTPWDYAYEKSISGGGRVTTTSTYFVGPAVRYYFPFGSWAVFPTASFMHGWRTMKYGNPDYNDFTTRVKGNMNSFSGGVGITYFVAKNVGVEGVLSYQRDSATSRDVANQLSRESTEDDSQINLSIGVQVYLSKK